MVPAANVILPAYELFAGTSHFGFSQSLEKQVLKDVAEGNF